MTQSVCSAMASTDAVSSHPFALLSRGIPRPHHPWDLRRISAISPPNYSSVA